MKLQRPIPIREGMILTCDTLSWHDGWEFDHPSMMLRPVIRCFENGAHHERIVEEVLIDAVVEKVIKYEDFESTWGWRGYKLRTLRRRFKESLAGKLFPKSNYHARRSYAKFILDEDGDLAFEMSDTLIR